MAKSAQASASAAGLNLFLEEYARARRFAARGEGFNDFLRAYGRARRPRSTSESLKQLLDSIGPVARDRRCRGEGIDIWALAGLRRNEVRTAAVLAWVLDPRGSHGQGEAISLALWERMKATDLFGFEIRGVRRVVTELCPLGDASDRVDVALEGADFVLFLEVKIDAAEGPDQLQRYREAARRKADALGKPRAAVAYLSQWAPTVPPDVLHLRWRDVGLAIEDVVRGMPDPECLAGAVLRQFARHAYRLH
jgi:PD-(D/E)XK nuclease superfamily protein